MKLYGSMAKGFLALSVVLLPACSTPPKGVGTYDVGYKERGTASWYGDGFHGKLTASGEIYDQYQLTAAHRMLPLGSRVRVTNVKNGRQVEVLVNDRGPFVNGRIIDLSYAAAERLDMLQSGTAPVFVEVLKKPSKKRATSKSAGKRLSIHQEELAPWYHRAALRKHEVSSRYGDTWLVPLSPTGGSTLGHLPSDLREQRRSRRLSALITDEAPQPILLPWLVPAEEL